ncbi:unnamed protein product [Cuscuta campestris]|uniref:Uncharacterized protein n=1 Tax=Cuscuta campestris TaxID=132261 RepID=A0A484LF55_9ASTE|nr:unnamed protein product [Cuscuta campestris]
MALPMKTPLLLLGCTVIAASSKACPQSPSPLFKIAARSPSLGLIRGQICLVEQPPDTMKERNISKEGTTTSDKMVATAVVQFVAVTSKSA